jgi:hypothetical protein
LRANPRALAVVAGLPVVVFRPADSGGQDATLLS